MGITGIAGFLYFVINGLFSLIFFCLVATAIISWLVAFNIINTRSPAVYRIMDLLDRVTAPILEPFRRMIPPIGGLDISFILACLVIKGIQIYLLPPAFYNLALLLGG